MNIETKEVANFLSTLARYPFLAALLVPIVLVCVAIKFATAPVENIIFFGIIGICVLIYSAWVVSVFKGGLHGNAQNTRK